MIKIIWQDWAHNLTWEYSTQFWIQSLTLKLIPDKGPSAIAGSEPPLPRSTWLHWLCHHSLYQNTFSKNYLCKWLSFWFQCIFGTHSCYRHPHLSYLQKMDCYHQEGGLQKHWLTLREKLFCTAGRASCVGAKRQFWPQLYEPGAEKLAAYTMIVWTQQLKTHHK